MIRLLFSYEANLRGRMVRVLTRSQWSHVDYIDEGPGVLEAPLGRHSMGLDITMQYPTTVDFALGALPPRVERIDLNQRVWQSQRVGLYGIGCTPEQQKQFAELLREQIGKPYDWRAVFAWPLRRNWHRDEHWFCSELIAWGLEKVGLPATYKHQHRITPEDLWTSVRGRQIWTGTPQALVETEYAV